MGLIPEDWLVKKSTFTGQETFFNRELICRRVEEIMAKKDTVSLEEIAKELGQKSMEVPKLIISTKYGDKSYNFTDVLDISLVTGENKVSYIELFKNDKNNGGK